MQCPKCKSENVNISREQTGTIGGARTYGKKHHGLIYWIFVGWWIWIYKIIFIPFSILFGKRKKTNTLMAQKTFNKTVAICQDCGNVWKI